MKTYLWRVLRSKSIDIVGIITTDNILQYLYDYCRDVLDKIDGFEYQEITNEKEQLLCGDFVSADTILNYKCVHQRDNKGRFTKKR